MSKKPVPHRAAAHGRTYNFPLPHAISGTELAFGLPRFQQYPVYSQIPADLRARLENCGAFQSVMVTKADLDRLPESVWQAIKAELQLP